MHRDSLRGCLDRLYAAHSGILLWEYVTFAAALQRVFIGHNCLVSTTPFSEHPPPLLFLMSSAEQKEVEEMEEAVVEALSIKLWEFLVLPRLRHSEVHVVGRCGGIAWLAFLAAQRLRSIIVLSFLLSIVFYSLDPSNVK